MNGGHSCHAAGAYFEYGEWCGCSGEVDAGPVCRVAQEEGERLGLESAPRPIHNAERPVCRPRGQPRVGRCMCMSDHAPADCFRLVGPGAPECDPCRREEDGERLAFKEAADIGPAGIAAVLHGPGRIEFRHEERERLECIGGLEPVSPDHSLIDAPDDDGRMMGSGLYPLPGERLRVDPEHRILHGIALLVVGQGKLDDGEQSDGVGRVEESGAGRDSVKTNGVEAARLLEGGEHLASLFGPGGGDGRAGPHLAKDLARYRTDRLGSDLGGHVVEREGVALDAELTEADERVNAVDDVARFYAGILPGQFTRQRRPEGGTKRVEVGLIGPPERGGTPRGSHLDRRPLAGADRAPNGGKGDRLAGAVVDLIGQ